MNNLLSNYFPKDIIDHVIDRYFNESDQFNKVIKEYKKRKEGVMRKYGRQKRHLFQMMLLENKRYYTGNQYTFFCLNKYIPTKCDNETFVSDDITIQVACDSCSLYRSLDQATIFKKQFDLVSENYYKWKEYFSIHICGYNITNFSMKYKQDMNNYQVLNNAIEVTRN